MRRGKQSVLVAAAGRDVHVVEVALGTGRMIDDRVRVDAVRVVRVLDDVVRVRRVRAELRLNSSSKTVLFFTRAAVRLLVAFASTKIALAPMWID